MGLILAVGLVGLFLYARLFPLKAQDRLIRLEMRLLMREILPADLKPRIGELSEAQLVALRFASDPELPELVRQVLAGKLSAPEEIKRAIKTWKPDTFRV